jgi:hypothetical protein
MGKFEISLVKYGDFTVFNPRAHFPSPLGIGLPGSINNDKPRQEALEVQAEVTFGSGFAPAVFGPIHTLGDELYCARINQMDLSFETTEEYFAGSAADELRRNLSKMLKDFPKQFFG